MSIVRYQQEKVMKIVTTKEDVFILMGYAELGHEYITIHHMKRKWYLVNFRYNTIQQ